MNDWNARLMRTETIRGESNTRTVSAQSIEARAWNLLSSALIVALVATFAYGHVHYWLVTGKSTGIVLASQEIVLVALLVIRRQATENSRKPTHWFASLLGSFAVLLFRPGGTTVLGLGSLYTGIQIVGVALNIVCAIYLGRSFGIVAANRGVKSRGPYRVVRHPMYASYLIVHIGYLLASFSAANIAVFIVLYAGQIARIFSEESVLMRDTSYQTFAAGTRYRLIPYLF